MSALILFKENFLNAFSLNNTLTKPVIKMKFITYFTFLWIVLFTISSCKDEVPEPPFVVPDVDTSYINPTIETAQARMLLMEEHSGQRCPACINGFEASNIINNNFPGRINFLNIFTFPSDEAVFPNFITEPGSDLEEVHGTIFGWPSASFDRKEVIEPGEILVNNVSEWQSIVSQNLNAATFVNVHVNNDYDEATRSLNSKVVIHFTDDIPINDLRLSVALTEENVIDRQFDGFMSIPDFEHKHVFRDMLTPFDGIPLTEGNEMGREYVRKFEYSIPVLWQETEMKVIAFVHRLSDDSKVVYQSAGTMAIE